jgi:hypothetical protein
MRTILAEWMMEVSFQVLFSKNILSSFLFFVRSSREALRRISVKKKKKFVQEGLCIGRSTAVFLGFVFDPEDGSTTFVRHVSVNYRTACHYVAQDCILQAINCTSQGHSTVLVLKQMYGKMPAIVRRHSQH